MIALNEVVDKVCKKYKHSTEQMLQAFESVDASDTHSKALLRLALLVQAHRRGCTSTMIQRCIKRVWNQVCEFELCED